MSANDQLCCMQGCQTHVFGPGVTHWYEAKQDQYFFPRARYCCEAHLRTARQRINPQKNEPVLFVQLVTGGERHFGWDVT